MNFSQAMTQLGIDHGSLSPGANKTKMANAISVLNNGGSTQSQKEEAVDDLNDLWWDATFADQNLTGQAIFSVGYTVDPVKPNPFIRV